MEAETYLTHCTVKYPASFPCLTWVHHQPLHWGLPRRGSLYRGHEYGNHLLLSISILGQSLFDYLVWKHKYAHGSKGVSENFPCLFGWSGAHSTPDGEVRYLGWFKPGAIVVTSNLWFLVS